MLLAAGRALRPVARAAATSSSARHLSVTRQVASTLQHPAVRRNAVSRLSVLSSLGSVRFNSSSPSAPKPFLEDGELPVDPNSINVADFVPELVRNLSPEAERHIGFLKEIGLNFGWGPSTCVQSMLEHIHVYADLPWWATIVSAVVLIRAVQFPLFLKMSDTTARMKDITPHTASTMKAISDAQKTQDIPKMQAERAKLSAMYKTAGIKRMYLAVPFINIPVFYAFYNNVWKMASFPVPSMMSEGTAWFTDLTSADPTLILPVATAGLLALQISMGGESGTSNMTRQVKLAMTVGLPCITLAFAWNWPAGLVLYILTSSAWGLLQTLTLKNAAFRKWTGLYPLNLSTANDPIKNLKGIQLAPSAVENLDPKDVKHTNKKQIGGEGSWLDKLTKGDNPDNAINRLRTQANDKGKEQMHKKYEAAREKRLADDKRRARIEFERKRRMKKS